MLLFSVYISSVQVTYSRNNLNYMSIWFITYFIPQPKQLVFPGLSFNSLIKMTFDNTFNEHPREKYLKSMSVKGKVCVAYNIQRRWRQVQWRGFHFWATCSQWLCMDLHSWLKWVQCHHEPGLLLQHNKQRVDECSQSTVLLVEC